MQHKNRLINKGVINNLESIEPINFENEQPCCSKFLETEANAKPMSPRLETDSEISNDSVNMGNSDVSNNSNISSETTRSTIIHCFENEQVVGNKCKGFEDKLLKWAIKGNIHQNTLTELLKILRDHSCFSHLPLDARTFLKTKQSNISDLQGGGQYFHFGIRNGITWLLKHLNFFPGLIKLFISVDGVPLSKSSGSQFWPILGAVVGLQMATPFVIGIYHGVEKPKCSNEFLEEFVLEGSEVLENGLMIDDHQVSVEISGFICDAPARAFILKIKHHSGYFGCSKCIQEGDYKDDRMTFPEVNAQLRTDNSF